ncbi:hypothetical protein DFH06DRAFT_608409 [Mycena polygramma]|nr:hypothetical protein DFH06DRAFT_608409 [Mycena polygramma]
MVDAGNATAIAQTLAVCTPPKKEERDSFLRDLAGIFGLMLQSDAQYVVSTLNLTGFPWDVVANRTLAAASPLAAVNETINAMCFSQIATNGCFDWTQQCSDAAGTQTIPFDYLKCRYLNFDQGDVAPGSVFAATAPYDSKPYCEKTFNVTPPTKRELFDKYHFDEATIRKFPRVIYSQGGANPVRGIAPDEKWFEIAPTDPNAPRYLFADYATHTQDIITSLIIGNNDSSLMRVRPHCCAACFLAKHPIYRGCKSLPAQWPVGVSTRLERNRRESPSSLGERLLLIVYKYSAHSFFPQVFLATVVFATTTGGR